MTRADKVGLRSAAFYFPQMKMNVYNEGNITIGGVWAAAAAAAGAAANQQLLSLCCDSFSLRNESFSQIYQVINIQLAFIVVVVLFFFVLWQKLRVFGQESAAGEQTR